MHQYLEKFSKNHYMISGGNFLSRRQARPPPITGKKIMCLFCVSECPDHFWFWQQQKNIKKYVTFWVPDPPLFLIHVTSFLIFFILTSSLNRNFANISNKSKRYGVLFFILLNYKTFLFNFIQKS